jgi:hypothetical protein
MHEPSSAYTGSALHDDSALRDDTASALHDDTASAEQ